MLEFLIMSEEATEEIKENPNQKLYEFTQVFGHALKLLIIANQLPEFVLSKARDINAEQTHEILSKFVDDADVLRDIAARNPDSKVSNDIDFETKKMLYDYIEKAQLAVDSVSSPHYKLMLDRYIAATKLAEQVKGLMEELLKTEEAMKEARLEQEEA